MRRRVAAVLALVLAGPVLAGCGAGFQFGPETAALSCALDAEKGNGALVLMAQSVPTTSVVPCLHGLPEDWQVSNFRAQSGRTDLTLSYVLRDPTGVKVALTYDCALQGAVEVASDEPGVRRYDRGYFNGSGAYSLQRYYAYPGGCTTYQFDLRGSRAIDEVDAITGALGFVRRTAIEQHVRQQTGDRLHLDPGGAP